MDGVITHEKSDFKIDPQCVARLNSIIERTEAEVVISSSWRMLFRRATITARLERAGFKGQVVGQTPRLPGYNRGKEVASYLAKEPGQISYVILDDVPDLHPLSSRLVLTDEAVGLQDHDVERAVLILQGKLQG